MKNPTAPSHLRPVLVQQCMPSLPPSTAKCWRELTLAPLRAGACSSKLPILKPSSCWAGPSGIAEVLRMTRSLVRSTGPKGPMHLHVKRFMVGWSNSDVVIWVSRGTSIFLCWPLIQPGEMINEAMRCGQMLIWVAQQVWTRHCLSIDGVGPAAGRRSAAASVH